MTIIAPDGKSSVTADFVGKPDEPVLLLTLTSSAGESVERAGRGIGAELIWAPDSKAFAVTTSNGGRNGIFDTYLFILTSSGLKKIDVSPRVRRLFGRPVKCVVPEPPNVAAVKWVASSKRILVAAEIVHHSVCDSFGTFKLYELAVPDLRLISQYDQLTAKKLFREDLGPELLQARDECIRNPKACEIPENHRK